MKTIERLSETPSNGFPTEWYDLATERHFWMEWRFRIAMAAVRACNVERHRQWRVCDIGTGAGVVARQFEDATDWTVDGIEVNEKAFETPSLGRGRQIVYDITERRTELAATFDAAILFDVIEHIQDPVEFLKASAYHVRSGGWIFVNVPALPWFYSRYDEAAGHFRRYTRDSLKHELIAADLSVIDIRYWGFSLVPVLLGRNLLVRGVPEESIIDRGFNTPSRMADRIARTLMHMETATFKRVPVGTSVMAVARVP